MLLKTFHIKSIRYRVPSAYKFATQTSNNPIVVYDGVCKFCNSSVNFIIKKDPNAIFKFAPFQSKFAQDLLKSQNLQYSLDEKSTMLLFDPVMVRTTLKFDYKNDNKLTYNVYERSEAALRIGRKLNGTFLPHMSSLALWIPRVLRDPVYDIIGANRYKLMGKKDSCIVPSANVKSRFVDGMESEEQVDSSHLDPLDVENWYNNLKDVTFPTYCLPISEEEAKCIVEYYDDQRHFTNKMTDKGKELLKNLEEKIQTYIDLCEGCGAFVRLSTRSPKDVALKRQERTKQLLQTELSALNAGTDLTKQVIALIRCITRCMRVESAKEAMDFLLNSERTYQDLSRRILTHGGSDKWNMYVIIRKWVPILPEFEFRGFVHKRKLNGLTQYYKACFVPEMAQRKQELEKLILDFFATIVDKVKVDSFVIDFAVHENRVYLIELNDFGPTASPGLFDWKTDNQILHNGPFEFRVLMERPANVKQQIARPLRELMGWNEQQEQNKENKCSVQ